MARVLVAEDDNDIRALLHYALDAAGHEVEMATDGLDALRRYRPGEFDLLCTDLDMPRMNGVGLTHAIRTDHGDDIPILMLTGSATTVDIEAAHAAGIDAILKKPFGLKALREKVDGLLPATRRQ